MSVVDQILQRNADFVRDGFTPLPLNPSQKLMLIGCVDPRVDPADVLGLELGEAAVIRTVGGRVTPSTLRTMAMLGRVSAAHGGGAADGGWHLVVLHHTDCGMTDLASFPDLLAEYFEIPADQLDSKAVSDAHASVQVDVDVLKSTPFLPAAFTVTGLVYDVQTGRVEIAVPSAPLRAE